MKIRIHSGGQTGADLAGLWVGKLLGLPTGGVAPAGYKTLIGNKPSLKDLFGLSDHGDYRTRTIQNVRTSDVTLIFARNMNSPGTVLTKNSCLKLGKQSFSIPDNRHDGETLGQYWGGTNERHGTWENALKFLINRAQRQRDLGLDDDYFIINVAGNATKGTVPDIFEFTFVSLWFMLMLYGQALSLHGIDTNLTSFAHEDPVALATQYKDKYTL